MGHKCYKHIDGVNVKAKFSKDLRFRYRLEITLKNSLTYGKTACVVMQNPSYADEDVADKSVQFMEKIVFQKGLPEFEKVRRLIVVNQFAAIQTNGFQGLPREVGLGNDAAIETALNEADIIILGWGAANRFDQRKAFVLGLLQKMNGKQLFNWDFPFGFLPTTSVSLFVDFLLAPQIYKSPFPVRPPFFLFRGSADAICAFPHAFPPHAKTPPPHLATFMAEAPNFLCCRRNR